MVALSRAVGRKAAMEMLLTGDWSTPRAPARSASSTASSPPEKLDDEVQRARAPASPANSALAVAIGKEAFYRQAELGLEAAYAYTGEVMTRNMLARDTEEGIDAFLDKRPPLWQRH